MLKLFFFKVGLKKQVAEPKYKKVIKTFIYNNLVNNKTLYLNLTFILI
jgi:hypothetical protein